MDLDFVSVHKNAKNALGQYPAILTSHLVNNVYNWYLPLGRHVSPSANAMLSWLCFNVFPLHFRWQCSLTEHVG